MEMIYTIYEDLGKQDTHRVLNIYERLNKGDALTREQLHNEFCVSKKTIQRDIKSIRDYLRGVHPKFEDELQFNNDGYMLKKKVWQYQTNEEILTIAKVLLESRAFNKSEMNRLLESLKNSASPEGRNVIEDIISNEEFHYVPVHHNKQIVNLLWQVTQYIRKQNIVKFDYIRQDGKVVQRTVIPISVMFSEYYFYLIAYFVKTDKTNPAIFRLDRISDIVSKGKNTNLEYTNRFEDGELRKKIQFMYSGKEITVKFKFWGSSLQSVLDKLPTAKVIGYDGEKAIIQADVFGEGIKMWLFSQMDKLELLEPLELRDEMRQISARLNEIYRK